MSDELREVVSEYLAIDTATASVEEIQSAYNKLKATFDALAAPSVEGERELTDKERNYLNKFYDKAYGRGEAKAKGASLARAREVAEIMEARCLDRCAICYWPLAESADKGCVRGNCSMRGEEGSFAANRQMHRDNVEALIKLIHPVLATVIDEAKLVAISERVYTLETALAAAQERVAQLHTVINSDPLSARVAELPRRWRSSEFAYYTLGKDKCAEDICADELESAIGTPSKERER